MTPTTDISSLELARRAMVTRLLFRFKETARLMRSNTRSKMARQEMALRAAARLAEALADVLEEGEMGR